MPNFHTGTISASAPTNALVSTSSSTIVPANNNRVGLIVVNLSSSTVYIGLSGHDATLNAGIAILGSGGNWNMDDYTYTKDAVKAIAHSAGNIITVQEFFT